jgi:hypothetical protein
MILISVKYHGPTTHRGSKWVATMADSDGGKLRASAPFDYGDTDGSMSAAVKVLYKWDDDADFSSRVSPGQWVFDIVGTTHDNHLIITAVFKYDGDI